ncbi:peptidoglycan-binding protein [Angustibacter sp. Root456]|uniref:peptidoglycan-binding protein n=1 Tax=Angustibacter sp. Root456 TaxID=1736539 RepID=UPI00138F3710|nr:peptidoglycan-binding protein [Angustibacter sp. Root456]
MPHTALPALNPPRRAPLARRRTASVAGLALLGSLLTGLLTAAPAQAAPSVTSTERAFVRSINSSRHASHRAQLRGSGALTAVARRWAQSMARSNRLAHNPRVASQVRSWRYLGENVGVGGSERSLHSAFMHSAPHRANVVSSRYTGVGVGVAYGHGRMWVVEVFARPAVRAKRPARTIGYGARGTTVKKIQRKLHVRATGYYGPVTRSRVVAFQKRHHLRATGKVDTATRRRMGV